jgi:ATP-dependent Clp protease ATP-binding subunit ClpA
LERFTDRARRVLVLDQEAGRLLNHSFIGTEHILLGLVHEQGGIAAQALSQLDIPLEAVRLKVEEVVQLVASGPSGSPPFTPRAKKVLEMALREALQLGHSYIGTEHILLGLVRESSTERMCPSNPGASSPRASIGVPLFDELPMMRSRRCAGGTPTRCCTGDPRDLAFGINC